MANRFLIVCGGTGYRLLGQRTVLGIDAELQIDVSKENVSRDWRVKDARSLFVDLDQRVGTTAVAFNSLIQKFKDSPAKGDENKNHIQMLVDFFPTALNLERGLAQSPAVGRAAIEHPYNERTLEETLSTLLTQFGQNIGPANPVEIWIVSSTAGGTGEGTHCFVAQNLAKIVQETFADTPLTMNFIRVGQLSYRSVNNDKTALNTFFGIAADAAFMLKISKKFPITVTNWFYIDLPDVGMGDKAKRTRGEIVEMACKSIMLPELQDDLQKLLVNRVGAPIVLVRTGYWGRDFGSNQKYFETLKQLIGRLNDLTEPNYQRKYIEGKPSPQVNAPGLDERVREVRNAKYVLSHMQKGWTFPRYRLAGIPKDLGQIEAIVSDWKNTMHDLVEMDIDHQTVDFRVDELSPTGDGTQRISVQLTVPASIQEDAEWFNQINNAHRVKGWAEYLLGVDFKDRSILSTGWIANLLQLGEQISKVIHGFDPLSSSDAKARKACSLLGDFLDKLVQVNRLLELEKSAVRLLAVELSETREVLKKANEEYEIAKKAIGSSATNVVNAAELNDVLDQLSKKTWLRLLRDAVRKGDTDILRTEVLRGATGLTEDGLRSVLGLQSNADVVDIQNTLATTIGHMMGDNNEEYEGQWWQATPPTPTLQYTYRILPQVDRLLQARLKARADEDNVPYRYIFTKFGTTGLYVLAFHGVSLNQDDGDTVSAPAFLLMPLVSQVKGALAKWSDKLEPNTTSGQLQIVAAGSGGVDLYERALRAIGLNDGEIKKLSVYYKMYN